MNASPIAVVTLAFTVIGICAILTVMGLAAPLID